MTKEQLYYELDNVNASRECRTKYANLIIANPKLFKPLLEILFMIDDKRSTKASWIVEFVCKHDISFIFSYIDYFVANLSNLHLDSAVRPCAKIIEIIMELNYKKNNPKLKKLLSRDLKEKITETCFDWLLKDKKVAVKVYSMTALYYLGTELNWIHPELQSIIERDYQSHSAGFKAKSRHILKKIKKGLDSWT